MKHLAETIKATFLLLLVLGVWGIRPAQLLAQATVNEVMSRQEAIREDLSATAERSQEYVETPGLFAEDVYQETVEQTAAGDIVLFTSSPRVVTEPQGTYKVSVSAFSPLKSVTANGVNLRVGENQYEATFTIDYTLKGPGDNLIRVEVESESGTAEKEFYIFYETETVKFADLEKARKSSFTFVTVLGVTRNSNANDATTNHRVSHKGSTTIVAVGQVATGFSSAFVITGVINADDQFQAEYDNQEVLFRQLSVDWNDTDTFLGDFTFGVGYNTVGIRDDEETSTYRDSWVDTYKQGGDESYVSTQVKAKVGEKTTWKTTLRAGQKTFPGVEEVTQTRKLGQGLSFEWLALPWETLLTYAQTDDPDPMADLNKITGTLTVRPAWKPLTFLAEYGYADTQYVEYDPTKEAREQTAVMHATLGVTWPLPGGASLDYSHRFEIQESNLSGKDFSKNLDTLNLTFIF